MITNFKKFENIEKGISFIPNDLVQYYENEVELYLLPFIRDDIKEFFNKFLLGSDIFFYCKECSGDRKDGWGVETKYTNKSHKGIVKGYGMGIVNDKLHLSLKLNRIRHEHEVDINKPFTIFSELPNDVLEIIKEMNFKRDTNKYNL